MPIKVKDKVKDIYQHLIDTIRISCISNSTYKAISTFGVKRKVGDKHLGWGGLVRTFYWKLLQRAGILD
jgi:hypothetical protein